MIFLETDAILDFELRIFGEERPSTLDYRCEAEIMKRSFIVRLHRGLSNSKEIVFGLHRMSGHEKSKAAASRANKKSRSVRTGLQFPVVRIHRIIRHVGDLKQEVNNPGEQTLKHT